MFAKHVKTIIKQVQARMDARGWKQPQLAAKAGLSPRTVNDLMNPDRGIAPTMRTIAGIVRALECDIADLLAPLPEDEAILLDAYRRAPAGRKESALALLEAPEKNPDPPPPRLPPSDDRDSPDL